MEEGIYKDPEIGAVRFFRNGRCRRVSIRVHPTEGVRVSVPYFTSFQKALDFYLSKREWVLKTLARQKAGRDGTQPVSVEQLRVMLKEAVAYLPGRFFELERKYGFKANDLNLKNNVSNWGSCSTKGNVNLNIRLMMLPEYLRDYVILHELTHLKHHDHSPRFHELLEKLCADHFSDGLPEGLRPDLTSKYPVSHALEREIKKHHTTYQ